MENPWEQFVYPLLLNVWPENFRYWIKRLRCCFIIYNFNCFLILDCAPLKRLVSSSGDTTLSLILGVNVNSVNKFKQVVRLGGRHNMPPRDLDIWPFDLEVGVRVACDLGYPCAKFRLPSRTGKNLGFFEKLFRFLGFLRFFMFFRF